MGIYTALFTLANTLQTLYSLIISFGQAVGGLLFVGQALKQWSYIGASYVLLLEGKIVNLAYEWLAFYKTVQSQGGIPYQLLKIINYVDNLIDFISNPVYKVALYIRTAFPSIAYLLNDAYGFINNIITSSLGILLQIKQNPSGFILGVINSAFPLLLQIAREPIGFISTIMNNLFPLLSVLQNNPAEWIINQIFSRFPMLRNFIYNPYDFIIEAVLSGFENLLEKYQARVIRIFEKVLSNIF